MFPSHGSTALGKPNKSYKLVIFFVLCLYDFGLHFCLFRQPKAIRAC